MWKEAGRTPSGFVAADCGYATQVGGIEERGSDVEELELSGIRHLADDGGFSDPWWPPNEGGPPGGKDMVNDFGDSAGFHGKFSNANSSHSRGEGSQLQTASLWLSSSSIGAGGDCANDPIAYILTLQELLRMGEKLNSESAQIRVDHAVRLAQCVETLLKDHKKSSILPWDVERALFAAQFVFARMGENRASDDVAAAQLRLQRHRCGRAIAPQLMKLERGERRVGCGERRACPHPRDRRVARDGIGAWPRRRRLRHV
jgi:hypothetical protein